MGTTICNYTRRLQNWVLGADGILRSGSWSRSRGGFLSGHVAGTNEAAGLLWKIVTNVFLAFGYGGVKTYPGAASAMGFVLRIPLFS